MYLATQLWNVAITIKINYVLITHDNIIIIMFTFFVISLASAILFEFCMYKHKTQVANNNFPLFI